MKLSQFGLQPRRERPGRVGIELPIENDVTPAALQARPGPGTSDVEGGWPALLTAGLSVALILIDGFIVSAAAPEITRAFAVGADHMGLLIGAYTLPLAVAPMIFGIAGDRFGVKRLFALGVGLLMLASVFCALSASFPLLVLSRFLQGTAAAMISPQTLAVASRALGPGRRGFAIGVWGSVSSLGLLLGPIVGAAILAFLPWHAIFLMNLPLGASALLAFWVTVPDGPGPQKPMGRLPLRSMGLLILGAGLLVCSFGMLFRGAGLGFLAAFAGSAILYITGLLERGGAAVLVGPELLARHGFSTAALAAFAVNASSAGTVAILALSLLHSDFSRPPAVLTGAIFMPAMIVVACLMPFAGKRAQARSRLGASLLPIAVGLVIGGPLLIGWALGNGGSPNLPLCAIAVAAQGAGGAVLLSYASLSAMVAAGPLRAGLASGAISMSRNLGTALGAAALTGAASVASSVGEAFLVSAFLATPSLLFCRFYLAELRSPAEIAPAAIH